MATISDAFAAAGEAFRRTTPGFVLLFSGVTVAGYGLAFIINAATAPVNTPIATPIATWGGALLILLITSAVLAIHTGFAQSWAIHTYPTPNDALDALPATIRIFPIVILALLNLLAFSVFLRQPGAIIAITYWIWAGPVIAQHAISNTDTPLYRAIPQGAAHALRTYRTSIPLALLAAALLYLGLITLLGMLYVLPLLTLAHAIAYRDTHGL